MDPTITAAVIAGAAAILAAFVPILVHRGRKAEAVGAPQSKIGPDLTDLTQDRIDAVLGSASKLVNHLESLEAILHVDWEKKLTPEERERVATLQRMGIAELALIDDVLDRFAERKKSWGGAEVDLFREALTISSPGMGTGLFRRAIVELNFVMEKLRQQKKG